jgi:hypothetical protein
LGSWNDVLKEIDTLAKESDFDRTRRRHLKRLNQHTKRNVVAYYSGWLQKPASEVAHFASINDEDKNGFMASFHQLNWEQGLDLILHTPGGQVAATESIIDYIRQKFDDDVRVFVPQISMSGGTMLACAGKEILLGAHSNLGPIDPQFGAIAAVAVLKEFERAFNEIKSEPVKLEVWRPILEKYSPTFLSRCEQAIEWSRTIGEQTLVSGMFKGDRNGKRKSKKIVERLLSHEEHFAHGRHLHRKDLKDIGLKIVDLEDDQKLQDLVLTVHHSYILTLMNTSAIKIIENHKGVAMVKQINRQIVPVNH